MKQYAIGIGLNLLDARAILLRNDGKIVAEVKKDRNIVSANETIKTLLELLEAILAKSKKYSTGIQGIGCALGGIVNSKTGIVYWPQQGSYIALPLGEQLEKKYGFPVSIINDASACAWAEYASNYAKYKHLLYMFSGVGCGIIADGKLYTGRDGGAGELFLRSQPVMASRLGDFSIFKPWPVDLDMVKRAKELLSLGKETLLVKKISPTGELSLKSIFEAAKKKDRFAREVIREAAFALGVKIAMLINLFNPDGVIIGGGLEAGGDIFLEECVATIKKYAFNEMRKNCKISLSGLGADATSLGAAMLLLE